MSTQRHTLKTPPAKAARKLFKTVPQYLAWVRNAASDLQVHEENNAHLMRNLIRQIASRILIRARAQDDYFRQLFQMPEGFPKRITMKKMLVLNKAGEYTLKLPLVHNGPLRTFHMLVGPSHGVKNGECLLKLHEALTREQKTVQRHALRTILDPDDFVSPNKISGWLCHLLKKIVKGINQTETKHFHVASQTLFTKKGLTAFITLSPKEDENDNVMTVLLRFEVVVTTGELPFNFRMRHPWPRDLSHAQPEMVSKNLGRDIKERFQCGKFSVYLRCPIHKPSYLPDISMLPTRAKTYLEYRLKRSGTAFTSQSLPGSFSQLNLGEDHGDPRVWKVDYVDIEKYLISMISDEPRYRVIGHALELYDIIATYGNRIVPRLNNKTKRSVTLWLFKRGGRGLETIYGAFQETLKIVNECMDNAFSPAFVQTQENTLDEDMDTYYEVLNKHIERRASWERREQHPDEWSASEDEEERPRLNNIELLLRAIYKDDVKDAIRLVNIC